MATLRIVARIVFLLTLLSGCESDPSDDTESSEEVGDAESAFAGSDHPSWIPDDRPSPPPLALSWTTPIGSPALLNSFTLRVRNTSTAAKNYTLRTNSFGLDHRTVTS
jgi:hypothetical protein